MAKRALLIGINRYSVPGADLRGCVNDVENIRGALTDLYGFTDADITTLLDEEATKRAMERSIDALVDSGAPGDVLYLHYSGHGSRVPDRDHDEEDRYDEILCPHDLDWSEPFTDDWLRTTFSRLDPAVSLTVVMDCCHSGSNTRAPGLPGEPPPQVLSRFLPNPDDLARGGANTGTSRRSTRRRPPKDVHVVDIAETLITGCRDTQTSADAPIAGTYHGALTYNLVRALRDDPGATYRAVHAATTAGLKGDFTQVPQLEGRAARLDRPFLSTAD